MFLLDQLLHFSFVVHLINAADGFSELINLAEIKGTKEPDN